MQLMERYTCTCKSESQQMFGRRNVKLYESPFIYNHILMMLHVVLIQYVPLNFMQKPLKEIYAYACASRYYFTGLLSSLILSNVAQNSSVCS